MESNELWDTKANFAIVIYGFLSDFSKLKHLIESQTDLRIIYQKTSLQKLFIREDDRDKQ